jgi:hypothetical protein
VALHDDVGVEVVEGAVCLCAGGEVAGVETLDLVVAAAGPLLDCVAGERDEGVGLRSVVGGLVGHVLERGHVRGDGGGQDEGVRVVELLVRVAVGKGGRMGVVVVKGRWEV